MKNRKFFDEIHCDITKTGISYIPFASVSDVCRDNCITCVAPAKKFNIECSQKMPEDGLKRLEKSVKEWKCS